MVLVTIFRRIRSGPSSRALIAARAYAARDSKHVKPLLLNIIA